MVSVTELVFGSAVTIVKSKLITPVYSLKAILAGSEKHIKKT
jgi:hypothetical protein